MPVDLSRLEAGIYRAALSGTIQIDELANVQHRGTAMAADNGDTRYVLVIDVHPSTRMPFDMRHAGKLIAENKAHAIYVVGASMHVRMIAGLLSRLFKSLGGVEHSRSLTEAVTKARAKLLENTG